LALGAAADQAWCERCRAATLNTSIDLKKSWTPNHVLRRNQLNLMAKRTQLARPMVRCPARFDRNDAWRQLREKLFHRFAGKPLAQNRLLCRIYPMKLKHML